MNPWTLRFILEADKKDRPYMRAMGTGAGVGVVAGTAYGLKQPIKVGVKVLKNWKPPVGKELVPVKDFKQSIRKRDIKQLPERARTAIRWANNTRPPTKHVVKKAGQGALAGAGAGLYARLVIDQNKVKG